MRLLSLFLIFISQWIYSASDEGNITVNGETVEVSVETAIGVQLVPLFIASGVCPLVN